MAWHRDSTGVRLATLAEAVIELVGDEVLATTILDRLLHRSPVLNISGRSYRLRECQATAKSKIRSCTTGAKPEGRMANRVI